jgi:hypothetical protein
MDPWKRIRLAVCIALMLAMLAVGAWARIAGDWPRDLPGGPWYECGISDPRFTQPLHMRANPFVVLEWQMPERHGRPRYFINEGTMTWLVYIEEGRAARVGLLVLKPQ